MGLRPAVMSRAGVAPAMELWLCANNPVNSLIVT